MTTTTISDDRRGRTGRADLANNAAVLAALWIAYALVRSITAGDVAAATDNAHAIIDLQGALGVPSERAVQQAFLDQVWVLKSANVYYLAVHFPFTVGFLGWVWRSHRPHFARVRNAITATTAAGLVIHVLYPLTPPRMMDGFVDTAAVIGPDPYELGISSGANQLAAMPSLHVGWALLAALGIIGLSSSAARWLALAHPIVTLAVVVLTANHYWIDALVAVVLVTLAWCLGPGRGTPQLGTPKGCRSRVDDRSAGHVRPCPGRVGRVSA